MVPCNIIGTLDNLKEVLQRHRLSRNSRFEWVGAKYRLESLRCRAVIIVAAFCVVVANFYSSLLDWQWWALMIFVGLFLRTPVHRLWQGEPMQPTIDMVKTASWYALALIMWLSVRRFRRGKRGLL